MVSTRARTALLLVVGLLLVTNPVWLFSQADETRYTYERTPVVVENGTLTYGSDAMDFFGEYNDLNAVGCQQYDRDGRSCAFDAYLVTHGPVTVTERNVRFGGVEFVRLDGTYYRRIRGENGTRTTYDVERVAPRELLADVANDVTDVDPAHLSEHAPLQIRLAVKGGSTTSFEEPDDDELGNVYRRNGSYYTVILTNQEILDPPVPIPRVFLQLVGAFVLLPGVLELTEHLTWVDT